MSELKSKGLKALGWDFSGRLAMQGTGFVISIFLARLLQPSDFGLIAMVMVIVGIASVFRDIGLSGALIQRRRLLPVHYSSVFYFNVFVGLLLTCITYVSAGWIAEFYENYDLIPLAKTLSLSFVINAFSNVQATKLRKELNYGILVKSSFTASFTSGIIGVSLAYAGAGVWSLVAQTLSMGVIYNILLWSLGRWTPSMYFSFKALRQLWGFGFRMFLSELLDALFKQLDFLVIGKMFPPQILGFYQRAKSLNQLVIRYSSRSLMNVLFPVLSKIQNDLPRFQKVILKSLGIICFTTFLLVGGLYLVSPELIPLLFGNQWLPSVPIVEILILSGFGHPVSSLLVNVLRSRGNSKVFLRLEIYKKVIGSANLAVLVFWGIETFLYSLILVSLITLSLNSHFAAREIHLARGQILQPVAIQALLSTAAVTATLLLVRPLGEWPNFPLLLIKGVLFTMIYFLVNWWFNTSSFGDLKEQLIPAFRKKLA